MPSSEDTVENKIEIHLHRSDIDRQINTECYKRERRGCCGSQGEQLNPSKGTLPFQK